MNTMLAMAFVARVHAETDPSDLVLSPTEQARAMSIQVRGVVPTLEELEVIQSAGGVDETLLDSWLATPEFEQQVVRHHQSLFWNSAYQNDLRFVGCCFFEWSVLSQTGQSVFEVFLEPRAVTGENTDVDQWNRPQTVWSKVTHKMVRSLLIWMKAGCGSRRIGTQQHR